MSEFEGKTVENAVEKACEALNISKEKLKYNVISYGSSGIFGLVGVKKAKIRVVMPASLSEAAPEPVSEKESPVSSDSDEDEFEIEEECADLEHAQDESQEHTADSSEDEEVSPNQVQVSDEIMNMCRDVLQRVADSITDDASVSVSKTEEYVCFEIAGGNSAVLIGKRGQTLEAIQYLAEKIINKSTARRVRIRVDIEGYLDKRKDRLESLARRLAEKVRTSGKPSTIGQMNAHDRRIIHIALKDNAEVRTQSIGEGFYRKLVIFPKKKNAKKKAKDKK
jgi:spoIIIJ-associated protein